MINYVEVGVQDLGYLSPSVSRTSTSENSGASVVHAANITQERDYYPFGDTRIDNQYAGYSVDRQYIGEEYDEESQMSYLNARYLKNDRGQFISQDPVFWEIGQTKDGIAVLKNPQAQNSYSYAQNNPIVMKDPDGRIAFVAPLLLGAGAAILGQYGYDVFGNSQDGFSAGDLTSNLSSPKTYVTRAGQGGAVAFAVVAAPAATTAVAGQAAIVGVTSAGTSYLGNSYLGQPTTPSGLLIEGGVSAVTFGALSTVSKVPGRLPNFGTSAGSWRCSHAIVPP